MAPLCVFSPMEKAVAPAAESVINLSDELVLLNPETGMVLIYEFPLLAINPA